MTFLRRHEPLPEWLAHPLAQVEAVEETIRDRLARDPHFYDDPNGMSPAHVHVGLMAYEAAAANDFRVERPGPLLVNSNYRYRESNARYFR